MMQTAGFAELAAISNFSFLRGASHPQEMVETAAAFGYRAVSEIIFVQTLPPATAKPAPTSISAPDAPQDIWTLDSKLEKVKSPEVRAALRRLGTPLEKDD